MPVFRFAALVCVCVMAGACQPAASRAPAATGDVVDDFGQRVSLAAPPHRIVSLNPTTTELLFAIGAGDRLVGRSAWDVFPDSARLVPSVGDAIRPNVEAVLGAHPDFVVLYASQDNRPAYDALRDAGIATAAFKIDSIAQFARDTRLLGRLTGDSARAALTVDTLEATLRRVRAATAPLPHPSVFLHAWDKPIIAIGGGSFMSELIDIAGGRNIYADSPLPSLTVTLEDVVRRNPDVVLATPIAAPTLRASTTWRALPAVRAGRVLVYDTSTFGRPSVSMGAAAVSLAELLHPGLTP
jgi:ABC-type Fe3+-hydroxamate transport system substrate-binding protein